MAKERRDGKKMKTTVKKRVSTSYFEIKIKLI